MKELYELKEKLCDELKTYGKKDMSAGSLDVIDKLTHTIKNLDKIIEKREEEGYSGRYSDGMYDRDMSVGDRNSYARGRNMRRDSMGRYSNYSNGYSYHDGTVAELKEIMKDAPEEVKADIQKAIRKMETM